MEAFIQQQLHALRVSADVMTAKSWDKLTESYAIDLRLEPDNLLNEHALHDAYIGVLKPMMALAGQTGFEKDWSFRT